MSCIGDAFSTSNGRDTPQSFAQITTRSFFHRSPFHEALVLRFMIFIVTQQSSSLDHCPKMQALSLSIRTSQGNWTTPPISYEVFGQSKLIRSFHLRISLQRGIPMQQSNKQLIKGPVWTWYMPPVMESDTIKIRPMTSPPILQFLCSKDENSTQTKLKTPFKRSLKGHW